MRIEKTLTPPMRVMIRGLMESPRNQEELKDLASDYRLDAVEHAISALFKGGWAAFGHVWPPGYSGGPMAEMLDFPCKYQIRNMDLTLSHDWQMDPHTGGIFGHALEGKGWPDYDLWKITDRKSLLQELRHLRGKVWFTLGDEQVIIALFVKHMVSRRAK